MAFGVLRLTRQQRYNLAITFVVLALVQSLLGLVTTSWSVYICIMIAPNFYSDKSEVTFVFVVTGMYGTHVFFHNLVGCKICHKCYAQPYKKSTRHLLFLWTLAGCNTIINLLVICSMAKKVSRQLTRSVRQSMEKGMQTYLKDGDWKYTIDKMQVQLKCCGIEGYEDWHKITWLDKHTINLDADLVKQLRTSNEELTLPIIPWSCCRTDFPMQCFHDPLQQKNSAYLWKEQPSVVLDSINNNGCLSIIKKPVDRALTYFIVTTFLILFLEIVTVLISRILYTSCRNAILLEDPDGIAPGWIFGRGDFGWSRGEGLDSLMEGYQRSTAPHTSVQKGQKHANKVKFKVPKFVSKLRSKSSRATSDNDPISSGDEEALML